LGVHIYIYLHIYVYTYTHIYAYAYVYVYICIYIHMCVYDMYIYLCMFMWLSMPVCMNVCIYAGMERDRTRAGRSFHSLSSLFGLSFFWMHLKHHLLPHYLDLFLILFWHLCNHLTTLYVPTLCSEVGNMRVLYDIYHVFWSYLVHSNWSPSRSPWHLACPFWHCWIYYSHPSWFASTTSIFGVGCTGSWMFDSCTCTKWFIHMCDMTHSYKRHVSFMGAPSVSVCAS